MRRSLKKLIALPLLLTCVLLIGVIGIFIHGSENVLKQKQSLKFGATYMTMNNPFYEVIDNDIRSEVEAQGDTLVTRDPALDVDKQIQQIREFIQMRVRAIFLNPVDVNRLHDVLMEARQAGIPVIVVDSPVSDQSLVACTVVSDNYGAGVLCAKHLMESLKKADIILLEHNSAQSAVDRIRGFEDTIKGHEAYHVVARGDCVGQLENAMPVMENLLKKAPHANVVMALNDPSALGAMAALEDHKLLSKVFVYGVDGSPEAKAMIKEGNMFATAAQFPSKIGKTAAEQMYRIINGKTHETNCVIPVQLVTKNNVDSFGLGGWQ